MPRKSLPNKSLSLLEWSANPVVRPRGARRGSRIEAHGTVRYRVVGETRPGNLDRVIETRLGKLLTERLRSFEGLAGRFNELATEVRLGLKHDFARLGVDLVDFTILAMEPGNRRPGGSRRTALSGKRAETSPQKTPRRRADRPATPPRD
jgi:hypothetical protein